MLARLFIVYAFVLFSTQVYSHSGRTNSEGCHNNRKTGGYHCHNSKPAFASLEKPAQDLPDASLTYRRKDYPHWIDKDKDCQNERQEALIRRSKVNVKFKRNKGCTVTQGEWFDFYSGKTFYRARDLDVDHLVPLMWAHNHGAYRWSREQKRVFANDHENLVLVWDKLNKEKGAAGPIAWLPPRVAFRCEYVKRFDGVVKKYGLEYGDKERREVERVFGECG